MCQNCQQNRPTHSRNRCRPCYEYHRRTGSERPITLAAPLPICIRCGSKRTPCRWVGGFCWGCYQRIRSAAKQPRRITRTTDRIAADLTESERRQVHALATEFLAICRQDPQATPPPSPLHAWLMEQAGWTWNVRTKRYEGINE